MNFSNLVYYVAQYKYKNDLDFYNYVNTIISQIEINDHEILKFKDRNISIIENNLEDNVSKIKIYENNLLNSFIIFYFDFNYFNKKELIFDNCSYETILGQNKNTDFICTLYIEIK